MTVEVQGKELTGTASDEHGALLSDIFRLGLTPDLPMRDVILKVVHKHMAQRSPEGIACRCGWSYVGEGQARRKMRYDKHIATDVELNLTRWFHDQENEG